MLLWKIPNPSNPKRQRRISGSLTSKPHEHYGALCRAVQIVLQSQDQAYAEILVRILSSHSPQAHMISASSRTSAPLLP